MDSNRNVSHVALALDSRDKLQIAYESWDRVGSALTYAPAVEYLTNRGGSWEHRTLEPVGDDPSIALDSHDGVHVAYSHFVLVNSSTGEGNQSVRYATNTLGTWTNLTIWGWRHYIDDYPYRTALAIDGRGAVHLLYAISAFLRYATNETGAWTLEWLGDGFASDQFPNIAVDSAGRVHTAFLGSLSVDGSPVAGSSLIHGVRAAGNWTYESIAGWSTWCPCSSAMALDSRGHVHVVFNDRGTGTLKYATNAGGSWSVATVDSGDIVGMGTAIAIDLQGRPRVTYANWADSVGGRYATTAVDVSNWADFFVASSPTVLFVFLALLATVIVLPRVYHKVKNRGPGPPEVEGRP